MVFAGQTQPRQSGRYQLKGAGEDEVEVGEDRPVCWFGVARGGGRAESLGGGAGAAGGVERRFMVRDVSDVRGDIIARRAVGGRVIVRRLGRAELVGLRGVG